jgi:hypothetical protein
MKKIILFLIISLLLGCEKKFIESDPIEHVSENENQIKIDSIIEKLGIKPSGRDEIDFIMWSADSITYKVVTGMKNNHAWIAKFTPSGDEIYSSEIGDVGSYIDNNSIIYREVDVLFLRITSTQKTIFYTFNFESGKEISRIKEVERYAGFNIQKYNKNSELLTYCLLKYSNTAKKENTIRKQKMSYLCKKNG